MADPWAAFSPQADTAAAPAPSGGDDPWASFNPQSAPEQPAISSTVPQAFLDRLHRGQAIANGMADPATSASFLSRAGQSLKSIWAAAKEGNAAGFDAKALAEQWGKQRAELQNVPDYFGGWRMLESTAEAAQAFYHAMSGVVMGAGAATGEAVSLAQGGNEAEQARARRDFAQAFMIGGTVAGGETGVGDAAPLMVARNGQVARLTHAPDGTVEAKIVGGMPTPADFNDAARSIADTTNPEREFYRLHGQPQPSNIEGKFISARLGQQTPNPIEAQKAAAESGSSTTFPPANENNVGVIEDKLRRLWEEQGIHPAEAAHDAKADAFLAHDLSAAAANPTEIPPLVSPDVQPLSLPGRIVSDLKAVSDNAFSVKDWVQRQLAPISVGDDAMIRSTTSYLNGLRRISWDWARLDQKLKDNFTPEQHQAMWRAMDEESVMSQNGEKSEHMGLATLDPDERVMVAELSRHAMVTRMQMLDRGMVTDEGLPFYVPRVFTGVEKGEPISLGPATRLRETTGSMKHRKYLTAEESEAAAKAKFGEKAKLVDNIRTLPMVLAKQQKAIAAHDFMERVRKLGEDIGDPQLIEGDVPKGDESRWITVPDSDLKQLRPAGSNRAPLHIRKEWAPQFKAIMDTKFNAWDRVIVETKNRPMSLIMNSPFIHDSVVFSKALPSNPGNLLTFRFLRHGPQLLRDEKFMHDMLDGGMVLWGKRAGFKQDVTSMTEAPEIEPGRSLTAKAFGKAAEYIAGDNAAASVKRGVDKLGEFVHDKLLGEQVRKLQASLAWDYREVMRQKFPEIPDQALNVLAAFEANRFGGSLPAEAMSAFSRGFTNALFFSRQFTLGNLGVLKDAMKGPPEYVMATIRDMLGEEGKNSAEALMQSARRHAFNIVMLDMAMYIIGNSMIQSAVNVASGTPMSDEAAGYWWRLKQAVKRVEDHPLSPSSYLTFFPSISPTFYHEPGKEGKILLGFRPDGTAIYARSVLGRMGEDYIGLFTHPSSYLLTKMAPLPRAFIEAVNNMDGFGRPIFDPNALRHGDLSQAWKLAEHFISAELPMQQVQGGVNLVTGNGDYKDFVNTFGPYAPPPLTVTGSQGYPGGPAAGVVAEHQRNERTAQDLAMAEIKRMVTTGNEPAAREKMTALGMSRRFQNALIRTWRHPGMSKLNPRVLAEFYQHASPIEREILDSMRAP